MTAQCELCGKPFEKHGRNHKYCTECRIKRDAASAAFWSKKKAEKRKLEWERSKSKPQVDPPAPQDMLCKRTKECFYGAKLDSYGIWICDYISITRKARGCPGSECTFFRPKETERKHGKKES